MEEGEASSCCLLGCKERLIMEAAIEVDSSCCSLSIAKGFLDIFVETTGIAIIAIAVVLDIRELVAAAVTAGMLVALRDLLRLRS